MRVFRYTYELRADQQKGFYSFARRPSRVLWAHMPTNNRGWTEEFGFFAGPDIQHTLRWSNVDPRSFDRCPEISEEDANKYWDFALLRPGEEVWRKEETRTESWLHEFGLSNNPARLMAKLTQQKKRKAPEGSTSGTQAEGAVVALPRQRAGKSVKKVAESMGVNPETFEVPDSPIRPIRDVAPMNSGSGGMYVPDWQIRSSDSLFKQGNLSRGLAPEFFKAFKMPEDKHVGILETTEEAFTMGMQLELQACAYYRQAFEAHQKELESLRQLKEKCSKLEENLSDAAAGAREEKRRREKAERDAEKALRAKSRLEDKCSELTADLEAEKKKIEGLQQGFEEKLEEARLEIAAGAYNMAVWKAKDEGLDYMKLLIDPEDDITLQPRITFNEEAEVAVQTDEGRSAEEPTIQVEGTPEARTAEPS